MLAAVLVGMFARRGADRTVVSTAGIMMLGNLLIYAIGVPWLMMSIGVDLGRALVLGVIPFLLGDAIKLALATGLLPATWKLGRRTGPLSHSCPVGVTSGRRRSGSRRPRRVRPSGSRC